MSDVRPDLSTKAPTWRDLRGWQPVGKSLQVIAVALVVGLLTIVMYRFLRANLFSELRTAHDIDARLDLYQTFQSYARIFPGVGILCSLALGIGVFRLSRAPIDRSVRTAGLLVCGLIAIEVAYQGLWWLQTMSDELQPWTEYIRKPWVVAALAAVNSGILAGLLYLLTRISTTLEVPVPRSLIAVAVAIIAWETLVPLYFMFINTESDMPIESPWASLLMSTGPWLIWQGLAVYLVMRALRALHRPAPAEWLGQVFGAPTGAGLSAGWVPVASGLELYASALSWRVYGTIGGYLALMIGVFNRSQPIVKMTMFIMPVIALITAVVMVVGVMRYARQPDTCDAGIPAWMAAALMGIGVLLEAYTLQLVVRQLSIDATSFSAFREMREVAEQAQLVSLWAMGLGFVGLLLLMLSFGQLARYIQRPDLSSRIISIGIFMAVIASVVLGFRSYASSAKGDPSNLVAGGILIAVLALVAVLSYLGLVKSIAEAVREDADRAELPTARIVS